MQSARDHGVKNVIVTATSETYGMAQYVPIDEKHPAAGKSPYAASKVAADQLAISYHPSVGLPFRIVHPLHYSRPRQSARVVLPTIIAQIASGAKKPKLDNLTPTWDFAFVKDTVPGFLALADSKGACGEPVNIGTGVEISVGDLARLIASLMKVNI